MEDRKTFSESIYNMKDKPAVLKNWNQVNKSNMKEGTIDKCTDCPECRCKEYTNENYLGEGFRLCKDCKQEWWIDIDYTKPLKKD